MKTNYSEEIADDIELLVEMRELIVHTPENEKYLEAAARVEAYLATNRPN